MNTKKKVKLSQKSLLAIQDFNNPSAFPPDAYRSLLECICFEVGSVLAYRILNTLYYTEDFTYVLKICDLNPSEYDTWESYYKDAQIVALIKKNPTIKTSIDTKLEAMKTFIACELKCSHTNDFFVSEACNHDFAFGTFLGAVRSKIQKILGSAPKISDLSFEFGPGAAYSVKRNTSSLDKLGSTRDVTLNCYGLALDLMRDCPGWRPHTDLFVLGPPKNRPLNVVNGDRLAFVPKTAKTDRPIAIGPLLNVLIQKGLGKAIRKRLKPILNLRNSQDIHRNQARLSSIDGSLCTIDLSSASDTISYELVRNLLPWDWFELLDKSRSQWYEIDGKVYPYHKFSAMGNGYTFELETLIFYAICFATCETNGIETESLSVYGDDIIANHASYELISNSLSKCGFSLNSDKSFAYGHFRESCGGDFFEGFSVRPFFLKDELTYRTAFLFHNFLVSSGMQFSLPKTYRFLRQLIGRDICKTFKTWNSLDDGALLDYSMSSGPYNRIIPVVRGLKTNALKKLYGIPDSLYKLQFVGCEPSLEAKWDTYKSRNFFVTFRACRHVHF